MSSICVVCDYWKTYEALTKRLERMDPYAMMERQAKLVDEMIKAKKGTPLPIMVI